MVTILRSLITFIISYTFTTFAVGLIGLILWLNLGTKAAAYETAIAVLAGALILPQINKRIKKLLGA